ncbi:MAG TPA: hypothetical protein VH912_15705 [Streptosporangiaceae bacterium]|jgi:hypothetical protein
MLLLLSLGITVLGLLGSWAVYRRRGTAPAMRGVAWSLVPMGAYLTGTTKFLTDLVLSPGKWAGVIVIALAVVLYVVSGMMLRKGSGQGERPAKKDSAKDAKGGKAPKQRKPKGVEQGKPDLSGLGDDLGDIEEILKRRGIS